MHHNYTLFALCIIHHTLDPICTSFRASAGARVSAVTRRTVDGEALLETIMRWSLFSPTCILPFSIPTEHNQATPTVPIIYHITTSSTTTNTTIPTITNTITITISNTTTSTTAPTTTPLSPQPAQRAATRAKGRWPTWAPAWTPLGGCLLAQGGHVAVFVLYYVYVNYE